MQQRHKNPAHALSLPVYVLFARCLKDTYMDTENTNNTLPVAKISIYYRGCFFLSRIIAYKHNGNMHLSCTSLDSRSRLRAANMVRRTGASLIHSGSPDSQRARSAAELISAATYRDILIPLPS
jgi:hypothetical protein